MSWANSDPSCDVSWAGAVDGVWSDGSKWTGGSVPAADQHACISVPGSYTVTVESASPVAAIDITNPSATLWVKGGAITSVTFAVDGEVENAGTLKLESINGGYESRFAASRLHIAEGGVLQVNGGAGGPRSVDAVLDNDGAVNVSATELYLDTTGAAAHSSSGTITIGSNSKLESNDGDDTFRITGGSVANSGTFVVYDGGLILDGGTITGNDALIGNGDLTFGAGSTTTGALQIGGATTLAGDIPEGINAWVRGGLVNHATLASATPFTNAGTLRLESSFGGYESLITVASGGTFTNTGTMEVKSGAGGPRSLSGTLDNQGILRIATGFTIESDGVHTTSGLLDIQPGARLDVSNGDTLKVTGGDLWTRGLLRISGATLDLAGGRLNIGDGDEPLSDAVAPQVAASTLRLGAGADLTGNVIETSAASTLVGDIPAGLEIWVKGGQDNHATLTSASGFENKGTLRLESIAGGYDSDLAVNGGPLVNSGTLKVVGGSGGPRWLSGVLDNDGTVAISNSTLRLDANGGTHTISGTVNIGENAGLELDDPLDTLHLTSGTIANSGSLYVRNGRLQLDGGAITGREANVVYGTLAFGSGANPAASIVVTGSTGQLVGDVPAGISLWIKGGQDNHATLTSATGFTNYGTIRAESIAGAYESGIIASGGPFVNAGTLNINTGSGGYRGVTGTFSNTGTLTIAGGIGFALDGNGATHENSGSITVAEGGVFEQRDPADTFRQTGSATFANAGTLVVANGKLRFDGGSMTGNSPFVVYGTLSFGNATAPVGTVVTTGLSALEGDIPAGVTVWVKGGQDNHARLLSATGFTNAGTLRLESIAGGYESYVQADSGAVVNTGTILANRGSAGWRGVVGDFDNRGTLTIDNIAFYLDSNGGTHINTGTIDIRGGDSRLEMNDAGDTFRQVSGTITNAGSTGFFYGRLQLEGGSFTSVTTPGEPPVTGTPLHVIAGTLVFPSGSTFTGTVVTSAYSNLEGDIPAGVTVWVKGGQDGNARLYSLDGFTNAGTLRLESVNGGYESWVQVDNGPLVNTGTLISGHGAGGWRGIYGDLDNRATLTIDGLTFWLDSNGGTHTNTGTINIVGSGRLEMNDAADTFRQVSGSINNAGSTGFFNGRVQLEGGAFSGSGTPLHVINGTLAFTGGSTFTGTVVTSASTVLDGDIPSGATVRIRGGQDSNAWLTATGNSTNYGTLYLETINGGYHTELAAVAGKTFTNQGTIHVTHGAGGPRWITGTFVNHGTLNVTDLPLYIDGNGASHETNGTVNIVGAGRLELSDGADTFRVTGGTINNAGSTGFFNGRLQLEGGAFVSSGSGTPLHKIRGTLAFTPGSTFTGTIVTSDAVTLDGDVPVGAVVKIRGGQDGNAWLTSNTSFTNAGTIRIETINGGYHAELAVNSGGTFTNTGNLFSDAGSGGYRHLSADAVVNQGTVTVASGSYLHLARTGGSFTNRGTVALAAGHELNTAGGFTFENVDPGQVTGGGTLRVNGNFGGNGTVTADVFVDNGRITVGEAPNSLTVAGNLNQAGSATVELQLGMSDNDGTSDLLQVTGHATLGGPLDITRADGYLPLPCDTFAVVSFGTRAGGFSSVTGDDLGDGLRLRRYFTGSELFLAAYNEGDAINVLPAYVSVAEGGHATYNACLAEAPEADVTVAATAGAGVTVEPATITFTPSDWQLPKSFTITATDNEVDGPDVITTTVANVASSTVTGIDGFTREVTVEIADDDHTPVADPVTDSTDEDTPKAVALSASDPDEGDELVYSIVAGPAHGSLGDVTGTSVTYSPTANYHGSDSFTYVASDGTNVSAPATVSLTVNPVNDAPVATPGTVLTLEDTASGVLLAGTDVDGDALTYTVVGEPGHGTLSGTGASRTYTPAANYNGSDSFTFVVNDGTVDSAAAATVAVTITPVNDAPVATAGSATTAEDTPGAVTLAGTDVDGDSLTYTVVAGPGHGTFSGGTGTGRTYTPAVNYNGADSFTFRVSDGLLVSDPAQVSLTVTPVNDAPVATAGSATTAEDTPVTVTLAGTDVDGDALGYAVVAQPAHGTLGVVTGGTVSYTPHANYHGPDSFTFRANDGSLNSAGAATVALTVTPVNDAPVATAGSVTVAEDGSVSITLAGSDVDGDALTPAVVNGPAHGSLGAVAGGKVTYSPAPNYFGSDSLTFKVSDGTADSVATATVAITVTSVNDAPVAVNDVVAVPGGAGIDLAVTSNDTDVDSPTLIVTGATNGAHGTAVANGGATVRYTPESGYAGPDTFTYTVSDGAGGTATGSVLVNVGSAPLASDGTAATTEDAPVTVTMAAVDPDDAPLTYLVVDGPDHGTVGVVTGNQVVYTPAADFHGTDTFTFKANNGGWDSNVATVTVTVTPVNDVPVASNVTATGAEDGPITVTFAGTDVDGNPLAYSVVDGPAHGTLGSVTGNTVVYTPALNYNGSDSFTFKANDGTVDSAAAATASITVSPVNDAPEAGNVSATGAEDGAITVTLAGSDVDGDELTYSVVGDPAHGTLDAVVGNTVVYYPAANYHGPDSFTFRASDGSLSSTGEATASITVTPVNDAPVASAVTASGAEDGTVTVTLAGTDVDGDPLGYSVIDGPEHGTLGAVVGNTVVYTPAANYNGSDSFTFKANDGSVDSAAAAAASITVTPVNDLPVATAVNATGAEDGPITVTFAGSDIDGDELSYVVADGPEHGTLGAVVGNTVVYTPAANYNGSDSFTFKANDGTANSTGAAAASITVTPVNDAPVAANVSASGAEDGPITVTFAGSDIDGDELSYVVADGPEHGTLGAVVGNTVIYTPAANYNGSDSFTFKANDGTANSTGAAAASITVTPVNDAPVATNVSASGAEDGTVTVTFAGSDIDGDSLAYSVVAGPEHGTLGSVTGNTVVFTPAPNYNGPDSFTFRSNDGKLDSAGTATATITVTPVNDAPTATAGSATVAEDGSVAVTFAGNDIDGDSLTFNIANNPANGTLSGSGASRTYTPKANFNGTETFTFRANDGTVNSAAATVTITVTPANDRPTAKAVSVTLAEESSKAIALDGGDVDGDSLTYSIVGGTGPSASAGTLSGTGSSRTFTANAGSAGTTGFDYQVCDPSSLCSTAHVTITITPGNRRPVASAQSLSMVEGDAVDITLAATDPDNGPAALTYAIDRQPSSGTLEKLAENRYRYRSGGPGDTSFDFTASDGAATSVPATVRIKVNAKAIPATPCTAVNLTPTPTSPHVTAGTTVTYRATAAGCANAQFRFWVQQPNGQWSILFDYGSGSSFQFGTGNRPTGNYTIAVWARNAGSTAEVEAANSLPLQIQPVAPAACLNGVLTANPSAVFQTIGTNVTFNASTTQCANPQYRFWLLEPGGTWRVVQEYGPNASYTLPTSGRAPGTYYVAVWARAAGSAAEVETSAGGVGLTLVAPAPTVCGGGLLNATPSSPFQPVGTTVTFRATTTGCPNPQYRFWLLEPGGTWRVVQEYGPNASYTLNTAGRTPGTYYIAMWARNAGSTAESETSAGGVGLTLTKPAACSNGVLTQSPSAINQAIGASLTYQASQTGCANPQYRFWHLAPGGTWRVVQDFSPKSSYTLNTAGFAAGDHYVAVWIRNLGSTNDSDTSAGGVRVRLSRTGFSADGAQRSAAADGDEDPLFMPPPAAEDQAPLAPLGLDVAAVLPPVAEKLIETALPPGSPVTSIVEPVLSGLAGYRLVGADGGVYSFGNADFLGSTGAVKLNRPIVGSATTPSGKGYWLVASDGGVFSFGDATFYGSTGNVRLNNPIVGMAATPSGKGYWLVASDGGVFSFGDAKFAGSLGAVRLSKPVVGLAATPTGAGYWLVASDGGVFSFGDAKFLGSTGAVKLAKPIVGLAKTASGKGYWLVASDGGVFSFGDARFAGSTGAVKLNSPIVGLAPSPSGAGYVLVAADGGVFSFGDTRFLGSVGGTKLAQPVVAVIG